MSSKLINLSSGTRRFLSKLFRIRQQITLGEFELLLPHDHMLPLYLNKYPAYDRFLPTLGALLPLDSIVVDVGANVGDTTVAMYARNSRLKFLCIEPDQVFFKFLESNLKQLNSTRACTFNEAISNQNTSFKLIVKGGTARIGNQSGNRNRQTLSLDELISRMPSNFKKEDIRLLKSDTDGNDARVILSSAKTIRKFKPIIFMECQVNNRGGIQEYLETFAFLREVEYSDWYLFNNVGVFMERVVSLDYLEKVMRENLEVFLSTGFPRYFDLLVTTNGHSDLVSEAIRQHSQIMVP